ncbi:CYTH domain-containing protein [Flagellimonas olearia]|uniref:CYTH domain-containing protein n=1 Tax=Flagellimonas olearia TaxID=552546 RepID=A0A6I1DYV8_9FLAO|nr:CYTH domain-containing protein [Allomuricauda olearia]KAB7528522.1 CYTH domain-containing protein [Allomuricauda olearia]
MEHLEIERKFLVTSDAYQQEAASSIRIAQGFLSTDPQRTVRVRIMGNQGFLTVKGASNASGTSRFEWETEISAAEATNLIDLCKDVILEKVRFMVPLGDHVFEVDEFLGENKGLVVAEVELQHEDEFFERPSWLGEEVTGQKKYYNSQLSQKPFTEW